MKAQDTIQVGTRTTETSYNFPVNTWYDYSYTQQIYTAEEINHTAGLISEIAFFTDNTGYSRDVTVYMINTEKESFSSKTDWVDVDIPDIVYEGTITCNSTMNILFTNKFEYTGGNILICLQDKTGIDKTKTNYEVTAENDVDVTIHYQVDNESMITPENISTRNQNYMSLNKKKNVLRLIFEEVQEAVDGAPATPTNVTAEAVSQTEIALSWDAVQDAVSYNVYDDKGSVLDNVTETSYTVENLEAETNYCFKVSALNDSLESPASVKVCATTLRNPEIIVNLEEVELGDIIFGDFWSENNDKSVALSLECIETEITNVECDNEFFVLPEVIDFTANPVAFNVTYNKETIAVGEKTAELVITHTHGNVTIPMSANVYAPETPDVFELAQEITLQDGTFSATPDFENLHDNYNLPNEVNVGNTPDAV
ncbi:MAG: fibronectin type III domain-containing protein, partial [Clostridia bacterium]|nr:fibronectin type III domain-containing protein [Clostridia bacterium]